MSIGGFNTNLGPIIGEMRAELPPLIHDEAKAKLEVDLGNLEYGLVVVKSVEVHGTRYL